MLAPLVGPSAPIRQNAARNECADRFYRDLDELLIAYTTAHIWPSTPAPDGRLRGAYPHLLCSSALPIAGRAFAAHFVDSAGYTPAGGLRQQAFPNN